MKLPKYFFSLFFFVLLFVVSASSVFAVRQTVNTSQKSETTGKVRACEARRSEVQKRMSQLAQLSETMLSVFDRTALRIEDYYTNTVVPTGKIAVNYQTLVDAVQTKKSVANQAVAKAQLQADSFTCAVPDSTASTTAFRTQMQTVKRSLAEYRTAVKNLIVAVRSAKVK